MLGLAGLGHPFGTLPGANALEFNPLAQLVSEDSPDVTNSRRGLAERRSRGMKMCVITCVEVTLSE
jgi:hypothetical protein